MPCRELAYQIAEQFRVLGKPLGLRDCIIVGGMGKTKMLLEDTPPSLRDGYLNGFSNSWVLFDMLTCLSTDMVTQALELTNQPHVVVATPGRLADHIRSSSTFSMAKIQFLVRRTTHRASTYCFSVKERQSISPGRGGAQFLSFPAALFGRSWTRRIDC